MTRRGRLVAAVVLALVFAAGGPWTLAGVLSAPAPARLGPPPRDLAAEPVRVPLSGGGALGGASLLLGDGPPAANAADAVVLEAVYPTIDEAVADRLRIRLGPLGPPLAPLLTWQLRPRLGVGPDALRPIDRVGALRVPVLVVAGEADRHTTLAESRRLLAAAPAPKAWWMVPGAPHGDFLAVAPVEYERRVLAFFGRYLRGGRSAR